MDMLKSVHPFSKTAFCRGINVFLKHYAPNHMPDPKGKWPLLETINGNNSELHQSIYLSSQISRQRYKSLSQILFKVYNAEILKDFQRAITPKKPSE